MRLFLCDGAFKVNWGWLGVPCRGAFSFIRDFSYVHGPYHSRNAIGMASAPLVAPRCRAHSARAAAAGCLRGRRHVNLRQTVKQPGPGGAPGEAHSTTMGIWIFSG